MRIIAQRSLILHNGLFQFNFTNGSYFFEFLIRNNLFIALNMQIPCQDLELKRHMDAYVIEMTAESQGRPEVQEAIAMRMRANEVDDPDIEELLRAPTLRLGDEQLSQDIFKTFTNHLLMFQASCFQDLSRINPHLSGFRHSGYVGQRGEG